MEEVSWGYRCKKCGYAIQSFILLQRITKFVLLRIKLFLVYIQLLPIITYSIILFIVCFYILKSTLYLAGVLWSVPAIVNDLTNTTIISEICVEHKELTIGFLSTMVLYILLLLALLDLTSLMLDRFWYPFLHKYTHEEEEPISEAEERKAAASSREYLTTVLIISIILVVMHTFYKIFECSEVTSSLAELIFACLVGAAALLIAVGLWKKLDP